MSDFVWHNGLAHRFRFFLAAINSWFVTSFAIQKGEVCRLKILQSIFTKWLVLVF